MATQDQLEMAFQVADTMMELYSHLPPKAWEKELEAVAYKLARVAGFVSNREALEGFKHSIVDTIKRRHGVTA